MLDWGCKTKLGCPPSYDFGYQWSDAIPIMFTIGNVYFGVLYRGRTVHKKTKQPIQMAVLLKLCISHPILVKPKCVWKAVVFFNFQKFVYIFQLFVYNFSKQTTTSQTHFDFTNLWSKMHCFSATAIYFWQFSIGTPCTNWPYYFLM